jgi:hypothetical protein
MKIFGLLFLLLIISITTSASWLTGCNTTEPPLELKLELELEDVSCTEAWITLTTTNLQPPTTIELKQDNQTRSIINLVKDDTLLYIDSLFPNQTYKFQAFIQSSSHTSNEISLTTMDTTSHNFNWQTWTFGDIGSSVLFDVAIIDENNIWAVGEIMIADTSVNGYTTYNAVHWDGSEWTLHRIMFYTICGQPNLSSYPARAIFAFNENEIFIGGGGRQLAKISGMTQIETICLPFSMVINKIWGTSGNDLYVVGNNGSIAHYNGSQWLRIESGTSLNINDIWGDYNVKIGEWEILAVGGNILHGSESERVILKIKDNQAQHLNAEGTNWPLISVWFKSNRKFYVIGSGIYEKKFLSDTLWKDNGFDITHYTTYRIRGISLNDVMLVGAFGECLHFNGSSWKSYIDQTMLNAGRFYGVNTKENIIIAVGTNNPKAVITMGKRIN